MAPMREPVVEQQYLTLLSRIQDQHVSLAREHVLSFVPQFALDVANDVTYP